MGKEVQYHYQAKNTKLRVLGTFWHLFLCLFLYTLVADTGYLEGATYKTPNFEVNATDASYAKKVGDAAEKYRTELAVFWLGTTLRQWSAPCPITVKTGRNLGAGGETSFTFSDGEVFGWHMKIQGSEERILDSVLPHEISHTILASYFREPVPRWIDEGAATFVEADVERSNYRHMLIDFLKTGKGIPFNNMVRFKEYPQDQMPFYAQGFSVCEYMILVGGPRRLIECTKLGLQCKDWSHAINQFYGYENLGDLQLKWQSWIREWYVAGMPKDLPVVQRLADHNLIAGTTPTTSIRQADGILPQEQARPTRTVLIPQTPPKSPIVAANHNELNSPDSSPIIRGQQNNFTNGVGTTSPVAVSTPVPPLQYQGSYGKGLGQSR